MALERETVDLVRSLEEELLQPKTRRSPARLDELLAEEFVEFGSSGLVFDKSTVIERLRQEAPSRSAQWSITGFSIRRLCPDTVLATYRLVVWYGSKDDQHHTLRSSIWKSANGKWRMIFHQGTPTEPP